MKRLYLGVLAIAFSVLLSACDNMAPSGHVNISSTNFCTSGYSPGYYVGNPECGHWTLSPTGREVWVYYPRYSHLGPSTLDMALVAGVNALYYRSIWNSMNPSGWDTNSSYDRSRSTVIYNKVVKKYGSYDAVSKKASSPSFKSKLSSYKTTNKGKPKPLSKKVVNKVKSKNLGLKKPGTKPSKKMSSSNGKTSPPGLKMPKKKSTYSDKYKQMKKSTSSYKSKPKKKSFSFSKSRSSSYRSYRR